MRHIGLIAAATLLSPIAVAAQQNPFALTGGSVKTAYIVYDLTTKQQGAAVNALAYETGVTPDRFMIKIVTLVDMAGKKDTMITLMVSSGDSQYSYNKMGAAPGEGEVSRSLRPYLAREYAALNPAGKARFKDNLKLATLGSTSSSSDAAGQLITVTGQKKGSETIAGHACDVYQRDGVTACVLPQAPMAILRWTDANEGTSLVAKNITLNKPVPPADAMLPKGVGWKKTGYEGDEFALAIWGRKKESDPEAVPPATLAKFVVGYLASPQAAKELKEQPKPAEETGEAEQSDSSGN
jgi:hypothetical protein